MNRNVKKGVSLAEVVVIATLLGIVTTIALPSVMENRRQAMERSQIKKAVVDYEIIRK